MKKYVIGIDVGTTGTKAVLFETEGKPAASSYRSYPTTDDGDHRREQNAEDLWSAVCETVKDITSGIDPADVLSVSLSTQGGTLIPTDENFVPLRPAILWSDTRCSAEREEYKKEVGGNGTMYGKTGWMLVYALPLLETRWIRNHEPEIFAKTRWFLSVPDYIAAKMTGIPAVDMSNAGINEFTDVKKGCYDAAHLAFAGITEEKLPKLCRSGDVIGNLTAEAAEAMGLTVHTVLAAGAHDQYAVSLGAGMQRGGEVLVGSGTSWAITALDDRPRFDRGYRQSLSALPGKWGSITSLSSGGICLDWFRRNVAGNEDAPVSYQAIDAEAEKARAGLDGLFFYPFGEKLEDGKETESADPRGHFIGMKLSHDRYDMGLAVMEGICFEIRWLLTEFYGKLEGQTVKLTGGAARSAFWSSLLADILGLDVVIPAVADAACVGAAIMAGKGAGIYGNTADGVSRFCCDERRILPEPEKARKYTEAFAEFRRNAAYLREL